MSDTVPTGEAGRSLEELISSELPEDLIEAAADRSLSEDLTLRLLNHRELPARALELLAKNPSAMKHRRALTAIVTHPRTPRFVSIPIANRLFSFGLLRISVLPSGAGGRKLPAGEAEIKWVGMVSAGGR